MESGNGGASSKGVLVPVSETSDVFQNNILAPLKSAYLYEESRQFFSYKSAVLVKNPALEEKYCAFRAKRRENGYSEEDLKESYGFLLFDDFSKANALGESGVLNGNSTCTTLGDPSHGVYISMYSDCLDLNRWYHGKSGYIAIIRLTKGRVKKVLENYTQNFTAPTVGFDCHISDQLDSVSAKTSSFLAFERTQYYIYELSDDGSDVMTQSPSAACPFAIVSFSYTDTKATLEAPQEKSEEKKLVCHYFPWRGQLQIGTQFYDVGLRTASGALIPAKLPPVVKIDRAISMLDLRHLLPKAVFETCFSGEVPLDGLYCSLCELVSSEAEETSSLSLLLREMKDKDLALTIQLNDGGFLILLHPSHFLTYDDTWSSATDVLQGMFVFPLSQIIQRDTKFAHKKSAMLSEILQVLPVLSYAEGEVEKAPIDPDKELCEVLTQHMQSYAALINPGLASSPSREVTIFPDQYDVPDAHKHLYSSPEWTNRAWQSFRSYLSKPASFQLPVSKASKILAAGKEERIEDLDDDVYICLSSPEEAPAGPDNMESEDQRSPVNVETPVDSCVTSTEGQVDSTAVSQNDLHDGDATKDTSRSDRTALIKTDDIGAKNLRIPSKPDDLPAELIVSITSAEKAVTDESLSMISAVSATKHNDFQLSGFSTAKLQMAGVNSLNDETVTTKKVLDCPEVTNLRITKQRKLRKGRSKVRKKVSKARIETPNLQIPVEDDKLKSQTEDQAKESTPQLSNPSTVDRRKVGRRKHNFRKVPSRNMMTRSASAGLEEPEEQKTDPGQQITILMDLEAFPLRKKTERWDLKPVISECGRILVPHGSVDIADLKSLKAKLQSRKDEQCAEKMLVDTSVNAHGTVEMDQGSSTALETAEATTSKDEGNQLQNVVSDVNPELSILRLSDDGNDSLTLNRSEQSSKTDGTVTPPSKAVKEKLTDTLSRGKIAKKGGLLLSKLKSVLLRGKRKTDFLGSEETTADGAQNAEPCPKKNRVDSNTEMLNAITSVQESNVHVKEVSKMLSVDPLFAYALGLTPKETTDKVTEGQDTRQKKDSSVAQEQTILDKLPKILHRPPSIFPRRGRIKTLKKHQGISTEYVKKKWWLHFQTPACYASDKLKNKECTRDNSVRKTVKEKMNSACSSTDALNLLADLALSASNDQVPPQPDPALGRKPETSLKKCDVTKDDTSAEQDSVLHALLRQPAAAARPMQPLESHSPSHLVGDIELVGLVSKEHAYSLPPSSALLLGLPGTPFQVSPLSGSTRLLHHHHTMYANGIKTLHPSVGQKDRNEQIHRTPECLRKHMMCRRKLRQPRSFNDQDGSIQVTKQWDENYDFNLDSKFTSNPMERTIVRALHGPWDFSMQDTSEEVRLIVHMWIGLFYSRSTDRFFHVDSYPCSEESDSVKMPSAMVPAPAQSDLKATSSAPLPSTTDTQSDHKANSSAPLPSTTDTQSDHKANSSAPLPSTTDTQSDHKANSSAPLPSTTDTADPSISKVLDLSKKDDSALHQGDVVLDLSLRNSNAEVVTSDPQVNRKETSMTSDVKEASETLPTLKSSVEPQEAIQCNKETVQSTEINDEVNDVRSVSENEKSCTPSQKTESLEHTDVPSCKSGETTIPVQEEMESVSVQPENNQTASGTGDVLHGCSSDKTDMKDGIENPEATEMNLLQKHERDSSEAVTDKAVDSNKAAGDVAHIDECDETEPKEKENCEVKEKTYQEGNVEPSPQLIHTNVDSTNKESGITCNGSLVEDDKQLSSEEPEAISSDKAENVNEDVDDCTAHKGEEMNDDHCGNEDGLEEKDHCVSPVQADSDSSDQRVPVMCDGPDLVEKDSVTQSNPDPPLDEQPPQADNKDDACHDLQLKKLCANGSVLTDEPAISENCPAAPSEMEHISTECAVEKSLENDICLAAKAASPMSEENNCSLDGSCAAGSIPQTHGSVETGSPNEVNLNLTSDYHEDGDIKATEGEQKVDNTTEKELFHHQCHSTPCEAEEALIKETDLKEIDKTNEGLEKLHNRVVIPFIGVDISGEDMVQPHDSHSQDKVEEVVQRQEAIPFISETISPETAQAKAACSTSQECSQKTADKISLSLTDVSETNLPVVSESEFDERCSTPTMDEKPYENLTYPGPSSASDFSGHETSKNLTQTTPCRGSTSMKKVSHKSTVNNDASLRHDLHPDLELRTLRVFQSIDMFLPKSSHTDTSSQVKTADMKHSVDRTPNRRSKYIPNCLAPSHTSSNIKDKKISSTTPAVVSASISQELHTESTGHFLISTLKSDLEKVLGAKLQQQKTDSVYQHYFERADNLQETSVGQDYCHSYRSAPAAESLIAITPNFDQDKLKSTSQTNVNHEQRSHSQRPVMAVKPSKSDEIQGDYIFKDRQIENTVMLQKIPVVTYTKPATVLLEKKTEGLKRTSEGLNDAKQDASELSSKSSWFSNFSDRKSTSDQDNPLYRHQQKKIPSSSRPMRSFESAKSSSKCVDGDQGFETFHGKVGPTTKESTETAQRDCPDASTSHADYKDGGIMDDSLYLGPDSSLMCTVYNTSRKRPYSFLEQVSQRCVQDDPTEASMERESLIFSEQMKQLLKRTNRGHIRQQDTRDKQNLSCASPVTVRFCSLDEQEDSVDHMNAHLDAPSLFGQKIKVDMSDRKYLTDTTEADKTLHPHKIPQGTGNPMEHAGVSGVTSECTRMYEAMMSDVCAVKKVPSRPKRFRTDRVYPKTDPSYHFDFCDQMKREMDESFRSRLNSVVKKSCKTKYRFYIVVTSDDAFFQETKAQLEAEGHTAVQPSEFFLESPSSLLIIIRNEDIAEHICEVPHLLELKKSPGVQFAGIDEPDDVVNLTHQELFTRGGFIMFDKAVLEPLSLGNLEKMPEILQQLSKTGKWKWMLHYRDSRRLKENARLSAEAKEKKHFLNWCQETGILEVLPYHECDLMSRDQPDYLSCFARLQVQNISARYPVFITDTTTDSAFGKNGILTTTFESFLTYSPGETFTA